MPILPSFFQRFDQMGQNNCQVPFWWVRVGKRGCCKAIEWGCVCFRKLGFSSQARAVSFAALVRKVVGTGVI